MSKKVIYSMILSVLISGQLILSSPMNVYAAEIGTVHFMPFGQPDTSINSGYVEIETQGPTYKTCDVFYWNITPDNSNAVTCMDISIDGNGRVTFQPNVQSLNEYASVNIVYISSDGAIKKEFGSYFQGYDTYTKDFSGNGWYYKSFRVYGNFGNVTSNMGSNMPQFTCVYGSDKVLLDKLEKLYEESVRNSADNENIYFKIVDLYEELLKNTKDNENIYFRLVEILDSSQSLERKYDAMLELQRENNSWLEKIFNHLDQSAEKQKQEAQTQGNNSTSQGMDAIEDKGTGFANSLGTLTNSMSYNGTECAWNMPQIKLPAISGVMDEVVLLESQPIDFTQWVAIIPSYIMLVIQSLLTIGLIVYCFKELYNTIAYVLTLRKDDNS